VAINSETWETLNPDGTKTHFEFELIRSEAAPICRRLRNIEFTGGCVCGGTRHG